MTSQKTREQEWVLKVNKAFKRAELKGITLGKAQAIEDELKFLRDLKGFPSIQGNFYIQEFIQEREKKLKEIK